jgi:hypothetical protein
MASLPGEAAVRVRTCITTERIRSWIQLRWEMESHFAVDIKWHHVCRVGVFGLRLCPQLLLVVTARVVIGREHVSTGRHSLCISTSTNRAYVLDDLVLYSVLRTRIEFGLSLHPIYWRVPGLDLLDQSSDLLIDKGSWAHRPHG